MRDTPGLHAGPSCRPLVCALIPHGTLPRWSPLGVCYYAEGTYLSAYSSCSWLGQVEGGPARGLVVEPEARVGSCTAPAASTPVRTRGATCQKGAPLERNSVCCASWKSSGVRTDTYRSPVPDLFSRSQTRQTVISSHALPPLPPPLTHLTVALRSRYSRTAGTVRGLARAVWDA